MSRRSRATGAGSGRGRCACRKSHPGSSSCMLVLVKDAPETIASADVEPGDLVRIGGRCGQRTRRSGVGDGLMWPVVVVEVFEFVQGAQEVLLVPDQCPVQQLMPAGLDRTLHDRIHAWQLDAAAYDLDTCVGEDG